MATRIDWTPAGDALHRWYRDLAEPTDGWPPPRPEPPSSDDEHLRIARKHWCERIRATYVTVSDATTLFRNLIALGAPLDILTGASYVSDELTHHLGLLVHLSAPLDPPQKPVVPDELVGMKKNDISWARTFEETLRLFAFNLEISRPTYRAIAAVSSDRAVVELSTILADNLEELTDFGRETLRWMARKLPARPREQVRRRIPELLSAYESLCHGDPELLEGVAGDEITIETDPGNLGSLRDDQLAFMFYDTVTSVMLPLFDDLGWNGSDAWQEHYRSSGSNSTTATAAAVGFSRH